MSNARDHTRGLRIASVAALVVVVMAVFGALGGIGLAQSAIGLAQYQYGKKVTICHKGRVTLRISVHAWPAHERHGDILGPCTPVRDSSGERHRKSHGKRHGHQGGDRSAWVQGGHGNGNGNGNGHGIGNSQSTVQGGHGHGHGNGQSPVQGDDGSGYSQSLAQSGHGHGHGGNNSQ